MSIFFREIDIKQWALFKGARECESNLMNQSIKKMSLMGLILMIFTSVFGFANSPSAFYLMGYSAIPFYILSALLFFIPFALMMAEMGAAYRKEEGGIYSWMNNSVGPRYAFIGTFMWFSSYIIWMVSTSAKVWVPFSTFLLKPLQYGMPAAYRRELSNAPMNLAEQ